VTGWGKTTTAIEFIRARIADGQRVWFLAHLDAILLATAARLEGAGITYGWIWGQRAADPGARCQLVSVQTAARRPHSLPATDLVIVDECDLAIAASYQSVLDALGRPLVLGLTGTPIRADGRPMRAGGFDCLVRTQDAIDLIEAAPPRLARLRMWSFPVPDELDKVKIVGGDYDQTTAGEIMSRSIILGNTLEHWKDYCITDGRIRPTGIFCSSVDAAEKTAQRWRDAGYSAIAIHGKSSSKIQKEAIPAFEAGDYHAIVTIDKYLAGVDIPCMAALICLRKTMSLRVWLQMIGRVLRISPDWPDALCLDHVGNAVRPGIGNPLARRMATWSLDGYAKPRQKRGATMTLEVCEICYSCDVRNGRCQECGHQRQRRVAPGAVIDESGRLVELTLDPRAALRAQGQQEREERALRQRQEEAACRTLEDWIGLALRRGYNRPHAWARIRFCARQQRASRPRASAVRNAS